jgi:hypothetical protein
MPEWFVILLAVLGIIFIGLFFTALSLVKNFARLLFLGVLGFLLLVLAGRACAPIVTRTDPTLPPNQTSPFPPTATDREFNLPESLRDLRRRIDNFVFGDEQVGEQPSDPALRPVPRTSLGQGEELIYVLPEDFPDPITGQAPRITPQTSAQSTGTTERRPISARW